MSERTLEDYSHNPRIQQQIEDMVKAEERLLAQRKREECECKDGMFPTRPTRRQLLRGVTAAAASTAAVAAMPSLATAAAPPGAAEYPVPEDPTKVLGRALGVDGGYGTRSQFETAVRARWNTPTK